MGGNKTRYLSDIGARLMHDRTQIATGLPVELELLDV